MGNFTLIAGERSLVCDSDNINQFGREVQIVANDMSEISLEFSDVDKANDVVEGINNLEFDNMNFVVFDCTVNIEYPDGDYYETEVFSKEDYDEEDY